MKWCLYFLGIRYLFARFCYIIAIFSVLLSILTSKSNSGRGSWLEEEILSTNLRLLATDCITRGGTQISAAGVLELSFIFLNSLRSWSMPHTHGLSEMLTKFLYLYFISKIKTTHTVIIEIFKSRSSFQFHFILKEIHCSSKIKRPKSLSPFNEIKHFTSYKILKIY